MCECKMSICNYKDKIYRSIFVTFVLNSKIENNFLHKIQQFYEWISNFLVAIMLK